MSGERELPPPLFVDGLRATAVLLVLGLALARLFVAPLVAFLAIIVS
jgi:hypothetical protein